jgi:hypothetical protein
VASAEEAEEAREDGPGVERLGGEEEELVGERGEVLDVGAGEEGEDLGEAVGDAGPEWRGEVAQEGGDGEEGRSGPAGRVEEGGEDGGSGDGVRREGEQGWEEGEVVWGGGGGEGR